MPTGSSGGVTAGTRDNLIVGGRLLTTDPESAREAAEHAEQALMDQVAACRTAGELEMLYQATGQAWTPGGRDLPARQAADGSFPDPNGMSDTGIILKFAIPKGIPMIVTHRAVPVTT